MARKSRKNLQAELDAISASPKKVFHSALYVRISVENERKIETDSIGTQIQMLKDFASQFSDIKVYDVYCDNDVSGTDFMRPEFSRMMNDVRDKHINCIIVKDLSRLGRNYLESGEYLEKVFPFFGVRFISINDHIDTLERPVDLSAQLKNMLNEMYAKDVSKKICTTMRSLQEQGKFIGSQPPYGYMRNPEDKYSLLVDAETAPAVREMFDLFLQGYTIHRITNIFNEREIPSPGRYKYEKGLVKNSKFKNSVWFHSTIRRMLSDRIYLGWIENGKFASHFHKGGDKCVRVPKEDWIVIKGVHEPIIHEDVFTRVQECFADRGNAGANVGRYNSKGNQDNILRGKLRCGECGKSMTLRRKESHGKINMLYICPMHEHYNSSYCKKKAIKKEQLESMILKIIQNQMRLFTDARELLISMNQQSVSKTKQEIYLEQIAGIKRQISDYIEKKAALYQDYAEGLLSEVDYLTLGQEFSRKSDNMKIFIASLEKEAAKYAPDAMGSEKWSHLIEMYWEKAELSREMVEAFLEEIVLHHDGHVEVKFKNQDELEAVLFQVAERRKEGMEYAV